MLWLLGSQMDKINEEPSKKSDISSPTLINGIWTNAHKDQIPIAVWGKWTSMSIFKGLDKKVILIKNSILKIR